MSEQTFAPLPRLLGGALCLDFTNTVDPRHAADRHEYLPDYGALVTWSAHAGAATDEDARRLRQFAREDPKAARRTHRRALTLRDALYRLVAAHLDRCDPSEKDLAVLSRELRLALAHVELRPAGAQFTWQWPPEPRLDMVLWPVVASADALLRSPQLQRVHECPGGDGCGWLFLDTSKNQTRRWCSMRVCGNRAKGRRHQQRKPTSRGRS